MKINGKHYRTVWLKDDFNVQIIDQRYLPYKFIIENLTDVSQVVIAIKDMHVRGAGLIGATAGYGMYLAALTAPKKNFNNYIKKASEKLIATRPTAVNLGFAVERQLENIGSRENLLEKIRVAKETAIKIADEDAKSCKKIGEYGLKIIEKIRGKKKGVVNILTHCNAGWLAFVDYGSALAPIYLAHDRGINVHVWVDETRPRNQGSKLTAWELLNHGVPHTVISDNTGGHLMQHGLVDFVIVGSDRTTYTGDVANKIGTYLKALAARDNNVPFYVALPSSTIDWKIKDGIKEIPIEERNSHEVKYIRGLHDGQIKEVLLTPEKSPAENFGFDVTPSRLITGLITERGVCKADEQSILKLYPEHEDMDEKNYVKFKCNLVRTKLDCNIVQLNRWRKKLHDLGLIGVNKEGIGFGNISRRVKGKKFVITGTCTGGIAMLTKDHYTVVEKCDVRQNTVVCRGPIKASSESMSHAVIYRLLPGINAVVHVHNYVAWKKLLNKIPTTSKNVQYGTPEFADEIERLIRKTDLKKKKIFVAAGHTDGIFSFGENIQRAMDILIENLNDF